LGAVIQMWGARRGFECLQEEPRKEGVKWGAGRRVVQVCEVGGRYRS
jgi:hypothetical protein